MKKIWILLLAVNLPAFLLAQGSDVPAGIKLLVGTYTSGKSEGIYVFSFNPKTGSTEKLSSIFSPDPSYLAVSADNKNVYAVNELGGKDGTGKLTAFKFDGIKLDKINEQSTSGDHPCYVSIDRSGKWIVAGNYTGGNFAVFPIMPDGSAGNSISVSQQTGSSADKERQEKSHVHCTVFSPDNKYLLVANLGTDEIYSYPFNAKSGKLGKPRIVKVPAGAGPRHIEFHPNGKYAYLVEEMFGNVEVFEYKKGKLKDLQTISMVPPKFIGKLGAADIHISADGRFLYTSNRGDVNKISIFAVDSRGKLKVAGYQSVLGMTPRNFSIDPTGNFLLVANQNSDEVVIFRRNKANGQLTDTNQRIKIPNPVCLKWAN